ncbi:MAG: hypothetical protein WCP98_04815 [Actinomycetes bacterium]
MTKRRHAREVPPGDPIRGVIQSLAEDERHVHFDKRAFGRAAFEMELTSAGVRGLIEAAASGACRLWVTRTQHAPGLRGQTIYQICPQCGELAVFIEFKIAPDQELWVFSIHEDSEKGKYR